MPSKTLTVQNGNSCAAHCTAVSIMELTGKTITEKTAEDTIWPKILFKDDGNAAVQALVAKKNSDPRRIAKYIEKNHASELTAAIKFDDTQKTTALSYLPDNDVKRGLEGLYNLIKGQTGQTEKILPADDVYYNCSYLMMVGGDPSSASLDGLHNILVTSSGGQIYYYNSNEAKPCWTKDSIGWKLLKNANGGSYSYVFTGLCVAVQRT